ncbi:MAG: hypothetical protein AB1421_11350 [Pseudomonadota bacterium]
MTRQSLGRIFPFRRFSSSLTMYPRYYALRRVNPYRGVIQVVDVGEATAQSRDGVTWHLRADDGQGLIRPVGVWQAESGMALGRPDVAPDLIAALETHPALPFPIFDTWELWLLDKESGLPLALLETARSGEPQGVSREPQWYPFVESYTGFQSPSLAQRDALAGSSQSHRDILARMVNNTARPFPMTQWFRRGQSGVGEGAGGARIPHEWRERQLPPEAFPTLLVRENWNSRLEQSVIGDYHAWLAPLLLLWPRLTTETRDRLEVLACQRPGWLARIYRLLPRVVDPARLNAALVMARLEQAQGLTEDNWIEN